MQPINPIITIEDVAARNVKRWHSTHEVIRARAIITEGLVGTITPRQVIKVGADLIEDLHNADQTTAPWLIDVMRDMVSAAYEINGLIGFDIYQAVAPVPRILKGAHA